MLKKKEKQNIENMLLELQLEEAELVIRNERIARQHKRVRFALERHLTSKGLKMEFEKHKYLLPLYKDDAQKKVVKKPTQVCVSEWLNVCVFSEAEKGLSTMFVLPKQNLRNSYVKTRIDPLVRQCYADMMQDTEGSVILKKFKNNCYAIFVGSNAESEFVSMPVDQVIIDERDYCDQNNIKLAKKRHGHSRYKLEIDVSTPTIKGRGIDVLFKNSDQKKWFVKCSGCGERQSWSFFGNVLTLKEGEGEWNPINSGLAVHCIKCSKEIDRFADGEYVGMNKSEISGYQIPALCHPVKTIEEIYNNWLAARHNEYEKQVFMNCDLGECYTPEGANISQKLLDKCIRDYNLCNINIGYNDVCTIGIDVGTYFHVIVSRLEGNIRQIIYAKKLLVDDDASIVEILSLIKRLRIRRGIIDAAPERKLSKKISELSGGVIWRCDYTTEAMPAGQYKVQNDEMRVVADRTWSIDEMIEDIKLQKVFFPQEAQLIENGELYAELQAPTRMMVKGARGKARFVWDEGSQADHFFHAMNYDKLAQKLLLGIFDVSDADAFQPKLQDRVFTGSQDSPFNL